MLNNSIIKCNCNCNCSCNHRCCVNGESGVLVYSECKSCGTYMQGTRIT